MVGKIKNTLAELATELKKVDARIYRHPCALLSNATIGQHTRHIIEFFHCMLNGYETGVISYDKRIRNMQLENDLAFAVESINEIINSIDLHDKKIFSIYELDNKNYKIETTYQRELMFNLEHCIHHQALLRIAIEHFTNIELPQNFGVSPSTVFYRNQISAQ